MSTGVATALIGNTGFVGGNLAGQFTFDECYHSTNISGIRGKEFDLLVCGGVTAMKWWANQHPVEDKARIDSLLANLASVRARKVIVLSTVDVYPVINDIDESFECHSLVNHSYGANRLYFEDAMRRRFSEVIAVRISGVFGPGLKKNVIYDLLHDNCLDLINPDSFFQYYDVSHLWRDIQQLEGTGIRLMNFVTEPIPTGEIIDRFFPGKRLGGKPVPAVHYDVRTLYSERFGGPPHYLALAKEVMRDLGEFLNSVSNWTSV